MLFHQLNDVLALNITPKYAAESLLTPCGQHTAPFLLFGVEHPSHVFKPLSTLFPLFSSSSGVKSFLTWRLKGCRKLDISDLYYYYVRW